MRNVLLQLGVAALVIGGFVVLAVKGSATTEFVALTAPILAAVFVVSQLNQRSDSQDEVLGRIHENTNGVLSQRIKDAVAEALAERGE